MSNDSEHYAAAWAVLDAVAPLLGATVESENQNDWHRVLRVSDFLWCGVSISRERGYSGPFTHLCARAPRECSTASIPSGRFSLSRSPDAIAQDMRRRVIEPAREPLRQHFQRLAAEAAAEVQRRQIVEQVEQALGESLFVDHSRRLRSRSDSCVFAEYDDRFRDWHGRPRFRATFEVDNLPAFLMMCRIAGECQRLKKPSTPSPDE